MKGKTQLRKKHLRCSSLDTLPLSTSTLTLFTSNKIWSAVGQVLSTHEQTLLDAHKICPAIEKILSMAEQIFLAGHPFWPAADQIFNPNQREIACPKTTARYAEFHSRPRREYCPNHKRCHRRLFCLS